MATAAGSRDEVGAATSAQAADLLERGEWEGDRKLEEGEGEMDGRAVGALPSDVMLTGRGSLRERDGDSVVAVRPAAARAGSADGDEELEEIADDATPTSCLMRVFCNKCMVMTSYVSDGLFMAGGIAMIVVGSVLVSSTPELGIGLITGGAVLLIEAAKALGVTIMYRQLLPLNVVTKRLEREVGRLTHENGVYRDRNTEHERLNGEQAALIEREREEHAVRVRALEEQVARQAAENDRYAGLNTAMEERVSTLEGQLGRQKEQLDAFHRELGSFIDANEDLRASAADMAAASDSFEAIAEGMEKGIGILKGWCGELKGRVEAMSRVQVKFEGTLADFAGTVARDEALQRREEEQHEREVAFAAKMQAEEEALLERQRGLTDRFAGIESRMQELLERKSAVHIQLTIFRRMYARRAAEIDAYRRDVAAYQRGMAMLEIVRSEFPDQFERAMQIAEERALAETEAGDGDGGEFDGADAARPATAAAGSAPRARERRRGGGGGDKE